MATVLVVDDEASLVELLGSYLRREAFEVLTAFDDHVVDVHVANLRKKLEDDPARPCYLQTVRGVGYRFEGRRG